MNINQKKPNVLIICTFSIFSGVEMHVMSKYKSMLKNGFKAFVLVPKNSILEKKFIEQDLPYYSFKKSFFLKPHWQPSLKKIIRQIILEKNINIIHCNRAKDIYLLKNINSNVKKIFTRHANSQVNIKYLKQFDAIIGVNKYYVNDTKKLGLNIPIEHLPPFFDVEELLNFKPTMSKELFFEKEFGIKLNPNIPTLVMVAILKKYKNHELILNAVQDLVYKKNNPVNLLLCGDGYRKKYLQKLVKKLNIENFVYFLGFTDKRLEVIYHSDINLLTNKNEAFGIVMLEASLLKKPLLGPTKTGMVDTTIIDQKTGLLFKNNNTQDLVEKIIFLLNNQETMSIYGQNAYENVINNLSPDILLKKLEKIYQNILSNLKTII